MRSKKEKNMDEKGRAKEWRLFQSKNGKGM